jgi:uncharacterized DUF497 family protein
MPCEWDPVKARSNFAEHGVYFTDAATVLEDDFALTIRDPLIDEEDRWDHSRCGWISQIASGRLHVAR